MNINAVYAHKHTNATLTLSFVASTQLEFNLGLSGADDEAVESFRQYSRDVETLEGDDVILATWEDNYQYVGPELRAAELGCAKRWKVVDATDDEAGEYEETAEYPATEPEARRAFRQLASAGAVVRLYSCEDDGEDLTEWQLEDMAGVKYKSL
jgi:hypothetical protein